VSDREEGDCDRRLLVLAPTSKDASLIKGLLASAGISMAICATFDALLQELGGGAAGTLVSEEALSLVNTETLGKVLAQQPPWSDLPVLVLTHQGADSAELAEAVRTLGNVTLLERPLRVATLLSAVRTAIRARDRQYQIRGHLEERARAEEALRLGDRRKDEFLATLGHELRNPLAPLLTGLQLLKLAGLQDPVAVRISAVMERQIAHLIRLVDDLLEVSRITRGVIDVEREPLDLAFIMRTAIETSRPTVEAAGHELTVEMPGEPIMIAGDAIRLTQVFANLLTNAAKYTNTGGHIWLRVTTHGDRAGISVRDNGIGIDPEHLSSVFDMFTQVDRSNRRTQGGLGIGLTLARSLVTMHGGRVEARSQGLGAGSEFCVDLPLLKGLPPVTQKVETPRPFPSQRILVVDDNYDAAETLGALLAALGATVSVANGGHAALEVLDTFNPDAVLLDIGMPGMDGYEVSQRIRATSHHGDVLLIALTGWGQELDQRRTRAAGFDHHLVKPLDIDKLRDLLTSRWSES
jgi:signal transduction histidine kinase/CheY-like chemotaxis protein